MIRTRSKFAALLAVAALGVMSLPAVAVGQGDPVGAQYKDQVTKVETGVGGRDAGDRAEAREADDAGGALPFTGSDLGVLAIVAASLGAAGYGLRRLAVSGPNDPA